MNQSILKHPTECKAPKGFTLGKQISPVFSQEILQFIENEEKYKWTDHDGNITRYTINYGWDYISLELGRYNYVEIPECIAKARSAIFENLKEKLPKDVTSPEFFDNIIVTIYEEGQHLIPHYDADNIPNPITKRSFFFAEPILGWVIQADLESSMTFYYHNKEGRPEMNQDFIYKAHEKTGDTFILDKDCRHFPFFHSIPPVHSRRVSMTLRRTILPEKFLSA